MRYSGAIVVLFTVFQTATFVCPTRSHDITEDKNDIDRTLQASDQQVFVPSRVLQVDDTCYNACNSNDMTAFRGALESDVNVVVEDEGIGGILDRFTGYFHRTKSVFGRLMNGLLKFFNRLDEDEPKYLIPMDTILPMLSNYSTKLTMLAKTIRQKSEKDSSLSKSPVAIQMMYNVSAENMEAITTVLDPILDDMRKQPTIDASTLACHMMQILTVLRDVTLPNIQMMAQLVYTQPSRTELQDMMDSYTTSTMMTSTTSTCFNVPNEKASSNRLIVSALTSLFQVVFDFLYCTDFGFSSIVGILSVALLIILSPLILVVGIIAVIFFAIGYTLFFIAIILNGGCCWEQNSKTARLYATIGAPLLIAMTLFKDIRVFVDDTLQSYMQALPTKFSTTSAATPVNGIPDDEAVPTVVQQTNDVMHHLLNVLKSPIETITFAFQTENQFTNMILRDQSTSNDNDAMDCELVLLKCQNEALLNVLPL